MSKEKKFVKKCVDEYTRVIVNSVITEQEVMQAQFPWSQLSGMIF